MNRRKQAVGWAYGLSWGTQGIRAATTLILAATVGPTEFGSMALALIFIGFIEMILQQGFVAAIIQRRTLRQSHVSSIFWLMIGISILLSALGILVSGYWAELNGLGELQIIPVLTLTIPLVALRMVPTALLTRHLKMKALTVRSLSAAVVSSIVAIPMAITGFGIWSLVAQHLVFAAASTVLVWRVGKWRPRFELRWADARQLLPFSLANFGARAGVFVSSQMDSIIIGLFWGPGAVGIYRLAARCVGIALDVVSGPLQLVSLPEFSKLQNDRDRLRHSFVAYIRFATLVTWPALAIVAVSAPYIPSVLGDRWVGVELAVVVLAIFGSIQTLTQFLAPLLQSVGKPGTLAGLLWIQAIVGAAVFTAVGSLSSDADLAFQTAAIGLTKSLLLIMLPLPAFLMFTRKLLALPMRQVFNSVLPAGACTLLIYVIGLAAREGLTFLGWNSVTQLLSLVIVLGLTSIAGGLALSAVLRQVAHGAVRRYAPLFSSRS